MLFFHYSNLQMDQLLTWMRKLYQPDTKLLVLKCLQIPKRIIPRDFLMQRTKGASPALKRVLITLNNHIEIEQDLSLPQRPTAVLRLWEAVGSYKPKICPLWSFRNSQGLPDLGSGLFGTSLSLFSICTAHLG